MFVFFHIAGYLLAIVMGCILGLVGTGGSMLTVPIMVYLFDVKPFYATGYALLVVGSIAAIGCITHWKKGQIRIKEIGWFVLPSTVMIVVTRRFILPSMPQLILSYHHWTLSKDVFIMSLLAILMSISGLMMLSTNRAPSANEIEHIKPKRHTIQRSFIFILLGSGLVGVLSGIVGAGGGFLMIPVLVHMFQFDMKEAIGTSLFIIMVNSLLAFQGDLIAGLNINWYILGPFWGLAIVGMLLGSHLGGRINSRMLQKLFGIVMLVLSVGIVYEEFFSI